MTQFDESRTEIQNNNNNIQRSTVEVSRHNKEAQSLLRCWQSTPTLIDLAQETNMTSVTVDGKSVEQQFIDIVHNGGSAGDFSFDSSYIVTTSFILSLAKVLGRPIYSVSTTASAEVIKILGTSSKISPVVLASLISMITRIHRVQTCQSLGNLVSVLNITLEELVTELVILGQEFAMPSSTITMRIAANSLRQLLRQQRVSI